MTLGDSIGHPDLYSSGGSLILKDQQDLRPRIESTARISIVKGATDINTDPSHGRVRDPNMSPDSILSHCHGPGGSPGLLDWYGPMVWAHPLEIGMVTCLAAKIPAAHSHGSLEVTGATDI